jgi:NADH-quinone oxidoreductase subunit K
MGLAAAEVAIGLALVVALYRKKDTVQVDDINLLKG